MAGVETCTVAADEADLRLDRWFKRHFPALTHGRLEKLLRTGQIRVDGKRAKAADRAHRGAGRARAAAYARQPAHRQSRGRRAARGPRRAARAGSCSRTNR